eukprot:CAMPEP_0174367906 /NCGR_PEP_ID=MMETSP0811_2-20130205/87083_1 /TAXON_ID=73025 ORGANISM="Eutreptiella gymnastica-like, Strain CCMP1594" /NCGR_SAMPLE_ID=MMETSP0811_2 /ASSEMBLY_ACC=CAM_ASM_000667 /LENGTH=67 /DNA_ID=CAMNT_0015510911 /DNA_START=171 /DNA_END=372 /DNA_ORIENTATION=-
MGMIWQGMAVEESRAAGRFPVAGEASSVRGTTTSLGGRAAKRKQLQRLNSNEHQRPQSAGGEANRCW